MIFECGWILTSRRHILHVVKTPARRQISQAGRCDVCRVGDGLRRLRRIEMVGTYVSPLFTQPSTSFPQLPQMYNSDQIDVSSVASGTFPYTLQAWGGGV